MNKSKNGLLTKSWITNYKKAYDELEKEGYIITRQGKGSYIAPRNTELMREEKLKEMEDYLSKALDIASALEIKVEEVKEILTYLDGREK